MPNRLKLGEEMVATSQRVFSLIFQQFQNKRQMCRGRLFACYSTRQNARIQSEA
jgi:hypothetical protein